MALASPLCSFPLVLKGLVDQADDLVTAYLPTCLLLPVGSTCAASISPPSPGPPPAVSPFQATAEYFLATLRGVQDLSSLTSDETHAPCSGSTESNRQEIPSQYSL